MASISTMCSQKIKVAQKCKSLTSNYEKVLGLLGKGSILGVYKKKKKARLDIIM